MARNEEKANSMLNRFLQMKKAEDGKGKDQKERRPYLATECRDLAEADKWRQQILREIGRKVMEIQNPGLGEHRLRDLNDDINKLVREKGHWERRIVDLGGPNYAKVGPKIQDADGNDVDVATGKGLGYRYFGAAKSLPGVRELFEKPPEPKKRRSRYEIFKRIDADYYGFRDDEDGVLVRLEKAAERAVRSAAVKEWQQVEAVRREALAAVRSGQVVAVGGEGAAAGGAAAAAGGFEADGAGGEGEQRMGEGAERREDDEYDEFERELAMEEERAKEPRFVAHVPLPDEKEIERMVLEKKKQELMSKYASESLIAEEKDAKELLNIKR